MAALFLVGALVLVACSQSVTPPEVVGAPEGMVPPGDMQFEEIGTQWMPPEGPRLLVKANFPTAIAVSTQGELFFVERAGRLWKVDFQSPSEEDVASRYQDGPRATLVADIPVSTAGERGLLGLALHPDFEHRRFVYVFVSPRDTNEVARVHRLLLDDKGTSVLADEVIIELPSSDACCHKGGRLAFGPDGKLYVALGDGLVPPASPDIHDLRGKVLRYEPDGSVPSDGPFGPSSPVWATGLRNPFGLNFSAEGEAYATDNGPSGMDGPPCCDELNRLKRGEFYGWPNSFGPHYREGVPPIWHSGERVVVPTGVQVISSRRFAALDGAVAFCTFIDSRMYIVDRDGKDWTEGLSEPGRGPEGCALDITQGPDERLYFSDTEAIYVWG